MSREPNTFMLRYLNIFQGTDLEITIQVYKLIYNIVSPHHYSLVDEFFAKVGKLYRTSKGISTSVQSVGAITQPEGAITQSEGAITQPECINTQPEGINNEQTFNSFRDYVLQESCGSNRDRSKVVIEVLLDIIAYSDKRLEDYINLKKTVLTESEWKEFTSYITGESLDSLFTISMSKLKQYIKVKCKENPALRSEDIDIVIQNIVKTRSLK